MHVLGISAFYHDSAAALVSERGILAAAQEERFTRKRHDAAFPAAAVAYCLTEAGLRAREIDRVVFYEKPFLKFERLLETYLAVAPRGFSSFRQSMPLWLGGKLFQRHAILRALRQIDDSDDWSHKLGFAEHHRSHAASAFYPSPFASAAILTMDGAGEWATTTTALGTGTDITIDRELRFPHSIGLLYSAVTYHLGFKVNSGEYKVMGLAPYGEPRFAQTLLDHVIDLKPDGSFRLDQSYFDYCTGLTMTAASFDRLVGGPRRRPEEPLTQHHLDLAASVQRVTEEIVLRLTRDLAQRTGSRHLCLAGGVALNCVANGKILADGKFEKLWVQPAAGDAGGALGVAWLGYYAARPGTRTEQAGDTMQGSLLGPGYGQIAVEQRLSNCGASFEIMSESALSERVAADLAAGLIVGWMQGRMEFGPRALGARSILADPRDPSMQQRLNYKIKHREEFRPFAPSVLAEDAADWFDLDAPDPYMLITAPVARSRRLSVPDADGSRVGLEQRHAIRSTIPAVTHVDFSARVQTVDRETNPRFHALLAAFKALTGCPVLVNTSFNLRGEPIVRTPEEAYRCFMATGLDTLAVGNCYLDKRRQDPALAIDYSGGLEPD